MMGVFDKRDLVCLLSAWSKALGVLEVVRGIEERGDFG